MHFLTVKYGNILDILFSNFSLLLTIVRERVLNDFDPLKFVEIDCVSHMANFKIFCVGLKTKYVLFSY